MEDLQQAKQPAFGFDYGTRARIRILGDPAFEGLLNRGLVGLTYAFDVSACLLASAPALILMFRSEETGRQCFERFRSWRDLTGSGDAIGLTFIEHPDGSLTICVYEETDLFVRATIPDGLRGDVEPHFGSAVYSMSFRKQSEGYQTFKAAVEGSPFLAVPATPTVPPMWDLAFAKRTIEVIKEESVPEYSRAARVLRARAVSGPPQKHLGAPPWRRDVAELRNRRRKQLRRFYPVLLEQLRRELRAAEVAESLKVCGYRAWQIEQAICNLNWQRRLDEADSAAVSSEGELMAVLVNTWERAELFSRPVYLDEGRLRNQLRADAGQLLDYTGIDEETTSRGEPQRLLEELGFLDA